MKRPILLLSLMLIALSACGGPPANIPPLPVETDPPAPAVTEVIPTATTASPGLPAPSFEAETYVNEAAGFALEYPAGWTVQEMVVGPRGTQVQFLSAPELIDAETLPGGATRLSVTLYDWEPKNDLAAYIANMKTAWDASGFAVLSEEQLTLESGLPAGQLTIQTSGAQVIFLVAALSDQYLVLSGEGNLDLVKEIAGTVRPISR